AVVAWFAVSETRRRAYGSAAAGDATAVPFAAQIRLLTGKTGLLLVGLIALLNALVRTGGLFAIIPILGTVQLGLSVGAIGTAMMLGSVFGLIGAYPAGSVADRFGRKPVIVAASVMTGASMLLFALAGSFATFLAASIVWGVASSVGGAAPAAYAADCAPQGMNAAAMSLSRRTADVGYVIGPLGLGLITDAWGPIAALLVSATLLVLAGATFALVAPE